MKRNLLIVAIFGLAVAVGIGAGQSRGQAGAPGAAPQAEAGVQSPIAVLDLVRIFNECAQIKDLNQRIREKGDEITKEANRRKEEIDNRQEELSAFQRGMPDWEVRRKELVRLNVEANVWFKTSEEEQEREKFEWTRVIYERAVAVAAEIAKGQGYSVVLQRTEFKPYDIEQTVQTLRGVIKDRIVVYHVPEIDITDMVIRRLDAQYNAAGGKKQLNAFGAATTRPASP